MRLLYKRKLNFYKLFTCRRDNQTWGQGEFFMPLIVLFVSNTSARLKGIASEINISTKNGWTGCSVDDIFLVYFHMKITCCLP